MVDFCEGVKYDPRLCVQADTTEHLFLIQGTCCYVTALRGPNNVQDEDINAFITAIRAAGYNHL
jgi:hypothetical protein